MVLPENLAKSRSDSAEPMIGCSLLRVPGLGRSQLVPPSKCQDRVHASESEGIGQGCLDLPRT
jgi:hypothetical protein